MPEKVPSPPPGASKFRHIFGQNAQRSESYDWGAGRATALAVNPKFLAACLEGPSGGTILVSRIQDCGKFAQTSRLSDHKAVVVEVKWNPFNDNVLASASADNTVKVWHVRDDGSGHCVRTLVRHNRKVEQIEWHTTVDDVVLTSGADSRILLWDAANDQVVFEVSDFSASCVAFSPNSSQFAATSRSTHRVTIFDARTGDAKKSAALPHDGSMPPKVIFCSSKRILTCGNTKANRRQFAVFSLASFSAPLKVVDIDGASGQLLPILDFDLNILYITGKGDTVIRFYEISDRQQWVQYLGESQQQGSHTALAAIPKRALNFSACEIFRLYRLNPESLSISPVAFIAPRRSESQFHADLYPPTRGPTPAASFAEWKAGLDLPPVQLQLRLGMPVATCKPVHLKGAGELITADVNNDRKFRFLSQVTKADYRVISEREDCDVILKMEEVKNKLASSKENSPEEEVMDSTLTMISISSNEYRSEEECDVTTASQLSLDAAGDASRASAVRDDSRTPERDAPRAIPKHVLLGSTPSIASAPLERGNMFRECDSPAMTEPIPTTDRCGRGKSAPLARLDDDSPRVVDAELTASTDALRLPSPHLLQRELSCPPDIAISSPAVSGEHTPTNLSAAGGGSTRSISGSSISRGYSEGNPEKATTVQPNPGNPDHLNAAPVLHVSASARELRPNSPRDFSRKPSPARSESGTLSRPGTISPRGTSREPRETSLERRYHYDTPKWAQRNSGLCPQYAHRCVEVDITVDDNSEYNNGNEEDSMSGLPMSEEGSRVLESAVALLERELRKSDARNNQLERLVHLQQQDIESLRFEIEWKDDRIAFLQSELARVEAKLPAEARDRTPPEE